MMQVLAVTTGPLDVGAAMPKIFISYRRDDASGHAGRLFDHFSSAFGADSVFMDVSTLRPGVSFLKALTEAIDSSDVMLVIIGRTWLTIADAKGNRRLDDPRDFVRLEVRMGLQRDIRVIPVLVEEAEAPQPDQLPEDLEDLAWRQATEIRDTRWRDDVSALQRDLEATDTPPQMPPITTESEPTTSVLDVQPHRRSGGRVPRWLVHALQSFGAAIAALFIAVFVGGILGSVPVLNIVWGLLAAVAYGVGMVYFVRFVAPSRAGAAGAILPWAGLALMMVASSGRQSDPVGISVVAVVAAAYAAAVAYAVRVIDRRILSRSNSAHESDDERRLRRTTS